MTFLALSLAHADPTAVIEAVATNLRSDAGALGCRLFAAAEGFPQAAEAAIASTGARIAGGQATCRFDDVAPGTYAVVVVHDENGNRRLDTNFLGIPSEGYGASNNHLALFGPPEWEVSSFAVAAGEVKSIGIVLRY